MGLSELFDVRAKQQLNRGYSDGMARGIELVLTPLFLGGIGWLLDRWLGTGHVLAIVLGVLGVIGIFVKMKLRLRRPDDRGRGGQAVDPRPWRRQRRRRPHRVGLMSATFTTRDLGPAPEPIVARDMAKRAVGLAPIAIGVCACIWGVAGAASAAYAVVIVLANLLFAAWMLSTAARISYGMLMGAALFGFLLRLALVSAAVLAVRHAGWVEPMALGLTLVVAHLGLLFWELRYVSISLAHPGLKPSLATSPKETSPR